MISLLFVILAAIANSVMDVITHNYSSCVFYKYDPLFWNTDISWKNKWKNGDNTQGEDFPGSSTIFVLTTDAWHLFKSLMLTSLILAIVFYRPVVSMAVDFVVLRIAYGLVFELFYSKLWRIK